MQLLFAIIQSPLEGIFMLAIVGFVIGFVALLFLNRDRGQSQTRRIPDLGTEEMDNENNPPATH